MRSRLLGGALACSFVAACSSPSVRSPSEPGVTPATPARIVAGAWTGTGVDSMGTIKVTWGLDQKGSSITGTVTMQAVDAAGSCNSCHRNKTGTFSGTIEGTTLAMTMSFPTGGDGDATPACSATLVGTASNVATDTITAAYSGVDSCEPPASNGTLVMTHTQ